ncbi:MAG TPA: oxygenase MpaB family protein [Acidimicrobiia bacterium]|nr:oxygenase MpaB family protein [Acidimicrobiia bacterium]
MDTGFFGPGSATWRINQELTVLFGGVRALLLHAAHPLVAAGARQTATYRRDPWSRLMRTLSLQLIVPFGTRDEAQHAADRINRLHTVINGTDPVTGERYDALDPALLLWVHACLEESTVVFYELTVGPLSTADKQRFHEENLVAAELILLPRAAVPATYDEMTDYIRGVIASDRLQVTDVAREVADLIRGGPVPWHIKPIWRFISFAAIGTLPEEVRRLYGFRFGRIRRRWLRINLWMLKRLRPLLPNRFRLILPARIARRRLAGEPVEMPRP